MLFTDPLLNNCTDLGAYSTNWIHHSKSKQLLLKSLLTVLNRMSGVATNKSADSATLHLPRILCLHGGGVNGSIFRAQLRSFLAHASLKNRFRFVFAEAPFFCDEGVGVHPVYSDWGPFRRWFRWLEEHPDIEDEACRHEVLYACMSAMEEDDRIGATGEWVGTLGFSQGAKVAVSLLYEMQIAEESGVEGNLMNCGGKAVRWKFAVVFAGRAPLVALSELTEGFAWCQRAGGLPDKVDMDAVTERPEMKLKVPTVHIHGLKDEGLVLHRRLLEDYCAPLTTVLVEWDGPHRIPLKKSDVDKVVDTVIELADEYGV